MPLQKPTRWAIAMFLKLILFCYSQIEILGRSVCLSVYPSIRLSIRPSIHLLCFDTTSLCNPNWLGTIGFLRSKPSWFQTCGNLPTSASQVLELPRLNLILKLLKYNKNTQSSQSHVIILRLTKISSII